MSTYYKRRGVDGDLTFEEVSLSTELILEAAREHGITCSSIPYTGLFELKYRGKTQYLHAQPPSNNTRTSVYCCNNKAVTKSLLRVNKLSVPKGFVVKKSDSIEYWLSVFNSLSKPLVVKPIDSSLAKNVYTNIADKHKYLTAIKSIFEYYGETSQNILVEEMFVGTEYRILATNKKVIGIMSRIPANVVGDGVHTITELVDIKNSHPWRGGKYALHPITIGKEEVNYLRKSGYNSKDIPAKKLQIFLRPSSGMNIETGGDTIDCTTKVHPSVTKLAIKAIRSVPGLSWGGIDFFSNDIAKPQGVNDYIILEINTSPNIAWQEFPAVGKRRRVALEYLKVIFPELKTKAKKKVIKTDSKHKQISVTNSAYISPILSV